MPPHEYFDRQVHKDRLMRRKWSALPRHCRDLIGFTFFEVLMVPGLFRERLEAVGPFSTPGGQTVDRYMVNLGFGFLVFGELRGRGELALIDFECDEFAMNHALRCAPDPH